MTTVILTPIQRLNLRSIVRIQQPATMALLETLSDILGKVDFSKEEIAAIDKGDGTADVEKVQALPSQEVSLEKAEVTLLQQILQPSERFKPTVLDLAWLKPLLESLKG